MKRNDNENIFQRAGTAIGTGLIAGLAGTIAMTISQMIEMKITGREGSVIPAKAAGKILDIKAVSDEKEKKVSNEIHWMYGTDLGMMRGALSFAGVKGIAASALHFAMIWGGEMILLPALKVAPPVTEEKFKDVVTEGCHIAVYAVIAGLVFDTINKKRQ